MTMPSIAKAFTPVLLAVVVAESRGFRTDACATPCWRVAAMLLGQAVGTLLWSLAFHLLLP